MCCLMLLRWVRCTPGEAGGGEGNAPVTLSPPPPPPAPQTCTTTASRCTSGWRVSLLTSSMLFSKAVTAPAALDPCMMWVLRGCCALRYEELTAIETQPSVLQRLKSFLGVGV